MRDLALDLEAVLDLLYDSGKADEFLLEIFKHSVFKGTMSESEYTYGLKQALYVKKSLVARGTVKVGKLFYQVSVTIDSDGARINFGDHMVEYYPKWDKFYKIYDELKKGKAVLLRPEDFKDFNAGDDGIMLNCENGIKILREIFKKAKVKCETAKDEKGKENGKDEKDDSKNVNFVSNEDLFFDDEGSVMFEDFDY
mgnify:CR=1 FL=1